MYVDYEEEDLPLYVWWRDGIWKRVDITFGPTTTLLKIRWVLGPRPHKAVLELVHLEETTELNAMEVLGLMAIEEIVP